MLKLKKCKKKNGSFALFIRGAKMYPVKMSIQIHARGLGIFFIRNGAIWRILSVPKYVKTNLKINNFQG